MHVAYLKQKLKQVLINRQHKLYEKETAEKNLTYDSWIKIQEKNVEIEFPILRKWKKSLTNDSEKVISGSCKNDNAGNY